MAKDSDEAHCGRDLASLRSSRPLLEVINLRSLELKRRHIAARHISAQLFASRMHILQLWSIISWFVRLALFRQLLWHGDIESLYERRYRIVGQLLLLVRGVACLRGAQTIAFYGLRKN